MVEASELKKAPIQRYADKFSNYLVPLNFLLCLSVWLVTRNPQKALKMLVIDYSCGIKLSTATAFSAAINTAVRCCRESAPMEGWQDDLEQDFRARRPKKEKR